MSGDSSMIVLGHSSPEGVLRVSIITNPGRVAGSWPRTVTDKCPRIAGVAIMPVHVWLFHVDALYIGFLCISSPHIIALYRLCCPEPYLATACFEPNATKMTTTLTTPPIYSCMRWNTCRRSRGLRSVLITFHDMYRFVCNWLLYQIWAPQALRRGTHVKTP